MFPEGDIVRGRPLKTLKTGLAPLSLASRSNVIGKPNRSHCTDGSPL